MIGIEGELSKKYSIKRENPVGKKMGYDLYFHKSYTDQILGDNIFEYSKHIPKDFKYDVVKYNNKNQTVSFISCPDFDKHDEPIVGRSITVNLSAKVPTVYETKPSEENPFVYHHKWMFVDNNYKGFNPLKSMIRSMQWKGVMESNQEKISSTIGRLKVWLDWCSENSIPNSYLKDPFEIFYKKKFDGVVKSAGTSVKQIPKVFTFLDKKTNGDLKGKVVFDLGGGKYPESIKEKVESLNGIYLYADPYNQPEDVNLSNIEKAKDGKSDIVTICNVLNVIPLPKQEDDVFNLLEQANNCLSEDGHLIISVYRGEPNKREKLEKEKAKEIGLSYKLKGRHTKGGESYQNRMDPEEYIPYIQKVFGKEVPIIIANGIIILSKNTSCNLINIYGGKALQGNFNNKKRREI